MYLLRKMSVSSTNSSPPSHENSNVRIKHSLNKSFPQIQSTSGNTSINSRYVETPIQSAENSTPSTPKTMNINTKHPVTNPPTHIHATRSTTSIHSTKDKVNRQNVTHIFGDSILLQAQPLFQNVAPKVIVHGKSGATYTSIQEILSRENITEQDSVIIIAGSNDAKQLNAETKDTIKHCVQTALNKTPQVLLISPPPSTRGIRYQQNVMKIQEIIKTTATSYNIPHTNINKRFTNRYDEWDKKYFYDGLHLTYAGITRLTQVLMRAVRSVNRDAVHHQPICFSCYLPGHISPTCTTSRDVQFNRNWRTSGNYKHYNDNSYIGSNTYTSPYVSN